ncbi:hypothetical protein CC85DRAFT_117143 [Cutaneotrichosporon oleaginosum]|uniref:Uncharacterized protein n=1 Tax=Cutaneotrichosporon oleaginosum TaxID=879819 RepID=A0A0J0XXH9_9TREE|nr:uncharacterized protein CC85DRAFT_117143 [Cutaneotrichosporon oleaginosum]KLT45775.1 hypothetical protein CC85DRAFT_117143 [Cutaneotrichosporon oleaginosum]TXT04461.1 hypothetical protein COLE_07280 [Cutaneotrichosporon oleaginosum]
MCCRTMLQRSIPSWYSASWGVEGTLLKEGRTPRLGSSVSRLGDKAVRARSLGNIRWTKSPQPWYVTWRRPQTLFAVRTSSTSFMIWRSIRGGCVHARGVVVLNRLTHVLKDGPQLVRVPHRRFCCSQLSYIKAYPSSMSPDKLSDHALPDHSTTG